MEHLQIQVAPLTTYKTCPFSTGPLSLDSVTTNYLFKEKNGKDEKKLSIVLNGGIERMDDTIVSMGTGSMHVQVRFHVGDIHK